MNKRLILTGLVAPCSTEHRYQSDPCLLRIGVSVSFSVDRHRLCQGTHSIGGISEQLSELSMNVLLKLHIPM